MDKLLIISVGPIQEFIASARRTSDLWYGSTLLSDISIAVAQSVQEQSGKLIFPENIKAESISNIILAEIPEGKNPKEIYEEAKKAGQEKWEQKATEVFDTIKDSIDEQLWKEQVKDAIEFYAVSVPITTDYQNARNKLMKIFAGRKALRNFKQSVGNNNFKSSLDGRRESVLLDGSEIQGIKKGEKLCAIGLIKRIQGSLKRKYPSVARITADCWIRQVKDSDEFKKFKEYCEQNENIKTKMKISNKICERENFRSFPFDGSLLFEDRYQQLKDENYINDKDEKDLKDLLENFKETEFKKKYGTIYPYFAILKADGDNMGKAISNIADANKHREFSKKLAEFSVGVKKIVEDNNGVCVYAGGDDVFAFLPLDCALDCARKLRESFIEKVPQATLSVGISVGHFMEPLEDLRNYSEEAEKLAKNNDDDNKNKRKDGLAILINPRNGGKFHVREQWKDNLDNKIKDFAELFNNKKLPAKFPYDLRTLATSLKYRKIDGKNGTNVINDKMIIENEIKILLKRKNIDDKETNLRISQITTTKDLFTFSDEMLVAQWFAMSQYVKEDK